MTAKLPKQTELKVSYAAGCKANIRQFETADVHLSREETWDVSGLTNDEIEAFESARYVELHKLLGARIESEYKELMD